MTVGELRTLLNELDAEIPVILSRDAEGNAFHHVMAAQMLRSAATVDLDVRQVEIFTEDDAPPHGVPVVVLWPVT